MLVNPLDPLPGCGTEKRKYKHDIRRTLRKVGGALYSIILVSNRPRQAKGILGLVRSNGVVERL